jgi:hypothetical protein
MTKQRVRITERLSSQKQAASGSRRDIPEDFKYNKKKLKHLKHILHNVNVAIGTLISAFNEFSRVKGPEISPDGLIGGVGFILPIKDIKEALNTSIRNLSDVADSLADELTNPHWGAEDDTEVKKLIKEKEEIEEKAEEVEENPVEDENPEISPEDIITSKEFSKEGSAKDPFSKAVQESLVRFSSIGKKNISKES